MTHCEIHNEIHNEITVKSSEIRDEIQNETQLVGNDNPSGFTFYLIDIIRSIFINMTVVV